LIARAAEHLLITELEIVTYALWWKKQLNVECPIILTGEADAHRRPFAVPCVPGNCISDGKAGRQQTSIPFFDSGVNVDGLDSDSFISPLRESSLAEFTALRGVPIPNGYGEIIMARSIRHRNYGSSGFYPLAASGGRGHS
jgi:hypothetical protein